MELLLAARLDWLEVSWILHNFDCRVCGGDAILSGTAGWLWGNMSGCLLCVRCGVINEKCWAVSWGVMGATNLQRQQAANCGRDCSLSWLVLGTCWLGLSWDKFVLIGLTTHWAMLDIMSLIWLVWTFLSRGHVFIQIELRNKKNLQQSRMLYCSSWS